MDYIDVVNKRKSIRLFQDKEISEEIILQILSEANLSPSAKNRQNWNVVIINKSKKNKICDLFKNENDLFVKNTIQAISTADVVFMVYYERNNKWLTSDLLSLGAFGMSISLSCTNLGLASLWIRDIVSREKEINKILNIENFSLAYAISIGYAKSKPYLHKKKKVTDIVINNSLSWEHNKS